MRAANICGIAAAVLAAVFAFYFALYTTGTLPTPSIGLTPVWTTGVGLLAAVKIVQCVADRAVQRLCDLVEMRFAAVNDRLDRVSESSLAAAQETGRWKGIAATLREAQQGDTGEVIAIGGQRRRQS
ncbi:hypothetical protein AB0I89_24380 [Micromonospora sp. NPDC049801]|uniref:hypothetical protein n=1 Tax=unclassified Micromonospora TaxID=2617518 RepID=UPI0034104580